MVEDKSELRKGTRRLVIAWSMVRLQPGSLCISREVINNSSKIPGIV
jgi:hypothetical protein